MCELVWGSPRAIQCRGAGAPINDQHLAPNRSDGSQLRMNSIIYRDDPRKSRGTSRKYLSGGGLAVDPAQCPGLDSITALDLLDCVVRLLTADGIMIIMNNHVSWAGWVGANTSRQQGLWNMPGYPTSDWIASLHNVSKRYSSNPLVVGMDISNEIHDQACPLISYRAVAYEDV